MVAGPWGRQAPPWAPLCSLPSRCAPFCRHPSEVYSGLGNRGPHGSCYVCGSVHILGCRTTGGSSLSAALTGNALERVLRPAKSTQNISGTQAKLNTPALGGPVTEGPLEEVTSEWEGALGGADGRAVKPETAGAKAPGQEWACVSEALSQVASRGLRAGRAPQGVATRSKMAPFDSASFPVTRTSLTQESVLCSLFYCSFCPSVIYKRERRKEKVSNPVTQPPAR